MTPFEKTPNPPRPQQIRTIRKILSAGLLDSPTGGIVAHATGSGKSVTLSELIRLLRIAHPGIRIVVSTPTVDLVEQLSETIGTWCRAWPGTYYTRRKTIAPITVCCIPSLPLLVAEMTRRDLQWDVWIADEAHRTEDPRVEEALAIAQPTWRIGFSATPYLSDPEARLSLWTYEIDRYSIDDAIAEGVLVPFRIDYPPPSGGRVVLDDVCGEWIAAQSGPGVVSAQSIAEADAYTRYLRERYDVRAGVIHSRMSRAEQEEAVGRLQSGDVRCLVHVKKLVEGVDFPWLQWIAFRAPRGRVAIVQELGRCLRSAPGKEVARVFDPHRLLARHGLNTPAALFEPTPPPEPKEPPKPKPETDELPPVPPDAEDLYDSLGHLTIRAIEARDAWISTCLVYLRAAGIASQPHPGDTWRTKPASDKQAAVLASVRARVAAMPPRSYAAAIQSDLLRVADEAEGWHRISRLRAGPCSDRIDLLSAFARSPARVVETLSRYEVPPCPI